MPPKSAGVQTFQFTCPICQSVYRVPLTATKFKCPFHDKVFHVKIQKKEKKPSTAASKQTPSMAPKRLAATQGHGADGKHGQHQPIRRMPQRQSSSASRNSRARPSNHSVDNSTMKSPRVAKHKGIYSNFEKEILLLRVPDLNCDGMDSLMNECDYKERASEVMCFNCKKRLCKRHSDEIHAHPERLNHIRMQRTLFGEVEKLFRELDMDDDEKDGKVSCETLFEKTDEYITESANRQFVSELLKANTDKFGPTYCIAFGEFITELAKHMQRVTSGDAGDDGDGDVLDLGVEANRYQNLSSIGRLILDFNNYYEASKRRAERFHIWAPGIKSIQSNFGANVSTYFLFLRFLFYLNCMYAFVVLVFLMSPVLDKTDWNALDYQGLLIGYGMEQSFMFYGGYTQNLGAEEGSYNMVSAYVMITALCIVYGLLAAVGDIGGQQNNLRKEDDKFKWCDAVFCGYDFQLSESNMVHLSINSMATQLKAFYNFEKLRNKQKLKRLRHKHKKNPRCCGCWCLFCFKKKFMGKLVSLALAGVSIMAVYILTAQEQQWINNVDGFGIFAYLLIPGIIALLRVIFSKLFKAIVKFENYKAQAVTWNHYFSRVFFLRVGFIFASVAGAYSGVREWEKQREVDFSQDEHPICQETALGMVFYRILICDYAVEMVFSIVFPLLKVHIINRCWVCICPPKKEKTAAQIEMDHIRAHDGRHGIDPAREEMLDFTDKRDQIREEFDIPDNLVDLAYRQMLVWTALPFCPFVPFLSVVLSALLMYTKKLQIFSFVRRPKKPMPVTRQHRYFRITLIVSIVLCLIPYTYFLTQKTVCGPHTNLLHIDSVTAAEGVAQGIYTLEWEDADIGWSYVYNEPQLTVSDRYVQELETLPRWFQVALNYVTSAVLLWTAVILLFIYVLTLHNKENGLETQLAGSEARLKMESDQRQKLLDAYGIQIGGHESAGRALFNKWEQQLNGMPSVHGDTLGSKYGSFIREKVDGDMSTLCKLTNDQLNALLRTAGCIDRDLTVMKSTIAAERHHIVYSAIRKRTSVHAATPLPPGSRSARTSMNR